MNHVIEARGLRKVYPGVVAVDNLSLTVDEGEIFGLLGPNGAGKTTTLRMLTGVIRPDSGVALIMGEDIQKAGLKIKRRISVVPQNEMALELFLTVRDNLEIYGRIRGLPKPERLRRIDKVLDQFEIRDLEKRIVDTLSPGQMRRVQIARAFLVESQLLFLDEPSLGLDPYARRKLWDVIRSASLSEGCTIFLTSHSMEEVEALCSRIAIIDRGKIIASGNLQQLKSTLPSNKVIELSVVGTNGETVNKLKTVLTNLSGVKEICRAGDIFLYVEDDLMVDEVAKAVRSFGFRIAKMTQREASLEDLYIRLAERRFEP